MWYVMSLFDITGRQTTQETDLADWSRDKISHLQNFYSNPILVGEKTHKMIIGQNNKKQML